MARLFASAFVPDNGPPLSTTGIRHTHGLPLDFPRTKFFSISPVFERINPPLWLAVFFLFARFFFSFFFGESCPSLIFFLENAGLPCISSPLDRTFFALSLPCVSRGFSVRSPLPPPPRRTILDRGPGEFAPLFSPLVSVSNHFPLVSCLCLRMDVTSPCSQSTPVRLGPFLLQTTQGVFRPLSSFCL